MSKDAAAPDVWPFFAWSLFPPPGGDKKLRLFAVDPNILEASLISRALVGAGNKIRILRESQQGEVRNTYGQVDEAIEGLVDEILGKGLNHLVLLNEQESFAFFEWDSRFFIVGGSKEFLSECYPMSLRVGRAYFDSVAASSDEEPMLQRLWEQLSPFM